MTCGCNCERFGGVILAFYGVYGNSNSTKRLHTWSLLRHLGSMYSLPWCCVGDFNEILHYSEKNRAFRQNRAGANKFRNFLDDCELRDLSVDGRCSYGIIE